MKKVLNLLLIALSLFTFTLKATAMTYSEAYNETANKPMAVVIYANWADSYQTVLDKFRAMGATNSHLYNFVELNIADAETKTFNQKFYIYPNLPYVMLIKKNGKVFRYLESDCILNDSCFSSRIQAFIH